MRMRVFPPNIGSRYFESPPALIGLGLAFLLAAMWWPHTPVLTATALIALGATDSAMARFKSSTLLMPILILQTSIYAALYGLLIGATLHAAALRSTTGVGGWTALDLALSSIPMAIALQHFVRCLRHARPPHP
ncbi:MAG TPA: hypothetical protein VHE81_15050 [Lacipirellulaceae bacterium]|nr:hypothetical protein [Lacipirellulaceae bacterium]